MTGIGAAVAGVLLVFAAPVFLTISTGFGGAEFNCLGCSSTCGFTVAVGC